MRLNEIENKEFVIDGIGDIIATNCVRSSMTDVTLYRGIQRVGNPFIGTIRQNRTVRDSSIMDMIVFNEYMAYNELPFRKSNTLSITVDVAQAKKYGSTVCQIFPFDDARYLYSTNIADFINFSRNMIELFHITNSTSITEIHEIFAEHHAFITKMSNFQSTIDPNELSKAKGEIIVYGTKYAAVPIEN